MNASVALAQISSFRRQLLVLVAHIGTIAGELDTVEEVIRDPALTGEQDRDAIEGSLREAIDAGMLIPDQAEELLQQLERMADSSAEIAGMLRVLEDEE